MGPPMFFRLNLFLFFSWTRLANKCWLASARGHTPKYGSGHSPRCQLSYRKGKQRLQPPQSAHGMNIFPPPAHMGEMFFSPDRTLFSIRSWLHFSSICFAFSLTIQGLRNHGVLRTPSTPRPPPSTSPPDGSSIET